MGQLEKYGLYVLCLVIFLILGVTIWGGGDAPPSGLRNPQQMGLRANAPAAENTPPAPAVRTGGSDAAPVVGTADFAGLLGGRKAPAANPATEPKADPSRAGTGKDPVASKDEAKAEPPKSDPAKPVVAADAARGKHVVRAGDSFEAIARQHFQSPALQVEIARLNPKVDPRKLRVDQELVLPSKAEAAAFLERRQPKAVEAAIAAVGPAKAAKAVAAPAKGKREYRIAKGDTFEGIAVRQLGSKRRVDEIRELNPAVDPTRLKVDDTILLPAK